MKKNSNLAPVSPTHRADAFLYAGLWAGLGFLLAAQVLMLAVLPAFPLYGETILNTALAFNIMVIPSVALLVYGAVQRYFASK